MTLLMAAKIAPPSRGSYAMWKMSPDRPDPPGASLNWGSDTDHCLREVSLEG